MSDIPQACKHGLIPSYCARCKYGTEDVLIGEVMEAREGLDPMTADIAEAFIRRAGMMYMDGQTPEELAAIAAGIARRYGATETVDGPSIEGFAPGWCCPKDYCCVQFVGDQPCPEGW